MSSNRVLAILALAGLVAVACGCSDDEATLATGTIVVSVNDFPSQDPVAGVAIEIAPVGLLDTTDSLGVATFDVVPGDYFVDASVCCQGPGFIEYHVAVAVDDQETETVELQACLTCQ